MSKYSKSKPNSHFIIHKNKNLYSLIHSLRVFFIFPKKTFAIAATHTAAPRSVKCAQILTPKTRSGQCSFKTLYICINLLIFLPLTILSPL